MEEVFKFILLALWTACMLVLGFALGVDSEQKKTDLPEEYRKITPETKIKGKYVKGKDLLIIEFDNNSTTYKVK